MRQNLAAGKYVRLQYIPPACIGVALGQRCFALGPRCFALGLQGCLRWGSRPTRGPNARPHEFRVLVEYRLKASPMDNYFLLIIWLGYVAVTDRSMIMLLSEWGASLYIYIATRIYKLPHLLSIINYFLIIGLFLSLTVIQSQINRPFEDPLMDLNYLADIDHGEVRQSFIKGKYCGIHYLKMCKEVVHSLSLFKHWEKSIIDMNRYFL